MAGGEVTRAIALVQLQAWLDADTAVSLGQAYSIAGRSLTRADANTILERIGYWRRVVDTFDAAALGADNPGVRIASATLAR